MSREANRSKSLRDLDSLRLSKSFPARPPGRPGSKKQIKSSASGGRKQNISWTLLSRRSSYGDGVATNSSSSNNNKNNSREFPQTPIMKKSSKSSTASPAKTLISPMHDGRLSRGNSSTTGKASSQSPPPARRSKYKGNHESRNDQTRHMSAEPRIAAHHTAGDNGGSGAAVIASLKKDGTLFLTVLAAPLQIALKPSQMSPANCNGGKLERKKCAKDEGEAKGAVIHELLPTAGVEKVDALVQVRACVTMHSLVCWSRALKWSR